MKEKAIFLILVILFSTLSLSAEDQSNKKNQTIYDLLLEEFEAANKARKALNETPYLLEEITALRPIFKSFKIGGKVDFKGKEGTTISADIEYLYTLSLIANWLAFTYGPIGGIKLDEKLFSWNIGLSFRAEGPFLVPKKFYPFAKIAISYKVPGGTDPNAAVFSIGPGIGFPIRFIPSKSSILEIDFLWHFATKKIFYDYQFRKNNDISLNVGFRIF